MKLLLFDTETTGLPKTREAAIKGPNNWPHLVSIAWTIVDTDYNFKTVLSESFIVKPQWEIPVESTHIHGISQARAEVEGLPLSTVIQKFLALDHDIMIAHNMNFDYNVLANAIMWDLGLKVLPEFKPSFCTMEAMKNIMRLPSANGRGYKSPRLTETYEYVVKKPYNLNRVHSAQYDTWLLAEVVKSSAVLQSMIGLTAASLENPNAGKKAKTTLVL
jgi:DNA polymerase III epsilon subunit-like protein